ncbi:MAG: MerR family transcriptional regulator [Pseudoclavibacter caeni]|jgi:DNA-binding transcriptional MerR regulator
MAAAARRSAAAAAAQGSPDEVRKLLSIGQVLNRLVGDFPDVTPSKIRFLEEQGLISPQRTASGYRKFGADDVERLRLILALQRDHYLPLKVIREYLAEIDAGRTPLLPGITRAAAGDATVQRVCTREELLEVTHADARLLREAVSVGLLPAGDRYDQTARSVLTALVTLGAHGIEPRHLRGVKAATDREIGLIEGAVSGFRRDQPQGRAQAAAAAQQITDTLVSLKSCLLERGVRDALD